MKNKIIIIIFLILLYIPSFIWFLFGDKMVGENLENRTLASKPLFEIDNISDYPVLYEAYYNDHLPFKNYAVKFVSYTDYKLFKTVTSNKVILGDDNWLFYKSAEEVALDDEKPIDDYQGINKYGETEKQLIFDNIETVNSFFKGRDIEFSILICSNKESIYHEYLPNSIKQIDNTRKIDELILYLNNNSTVPVLYPYDELMEKKDMFPLYYKYDTHWNELGGFIAAQEIVECYKGEKTDISKCKIVESELEPPRDLAGMLNMNDVFDDDVRYCVNDYKDNVNLNLIESTPDGILHVYNSNATDKRRIMVIRDSYGEALMPYLSKEFSDVIYVHRNGFDQGFIDVYQPDIVVYQVVERATNDLFDLKMIFQLN